MLSRSLTIALLAASAVVAQTIGGDSAIIAHTGEPVGTEEDVDGLTLYVTKPEGSPSCGSSSKIGVIYITDVFGIQLPQNKLLADSFARAGFPTVAPDLFDGSPAPADLNQPGFNTSAFIAKYTTEVTDPKLAKAIAYLREELGVEKVAATGYCFGGRYSFRLLAEGGGVDVGFAAHPSLLTDAEIRAITGPVSVAAAEVDNTLNATRRATVEALLSDTTYPTSLALYGGTSHGFGVRANISDPQQKFGKEEAFFQAVRFFKAWA